MPVVCVVGKRDIDAGVVSVRTYADGEVGQLAVDDLLDRLQATNDERKAFESGQAGSAST